MTNEVVVYSLSTTNYVVFIFGDVGRKIESDPFAVRSSPSEVRLKTEKNGQILHVI